MDMASNNLLALAPLLAVLPGSFSAGEEGVASTWLPVWWSRNNFILYSSTSMHTCTWHMLFTYMLHFLYIHLHCARVYMMHTHARYTAECTLVHTTICICTSLPDVCIHALLAFFRAPRCKARILKHRVDMWQDKHQTQWGSITCTLDVLLTCSIPLFHGALALSLVEGTSLGVGRCMRLGRGGSSVPSGACLHCSTWSTEKHSSINS